MVQFRLEMVWRGAMIDSSSCYGSIIRNNHTGTNSASDCTTAAACILLSPWFFEQKYKKMHTHTQRKNVNNRFGVTNGEKYCMRVRRSVRQKRFRMFGCFRGLCWAENVVEHANAHLIDISSYETSDAMI